MRTPRVAASRPFELVLAALLVACTTRPSSSTLADTATGAATVQARAPTVTSDGDTSELVTGNTAFALDLYHAIAQSPENLGQSVFFSPYSISLALAMTYAGARGETAAQIASALHFTLPPCHLHPSFGTLDAQLESRAGSASASSIHPYYLNVASSLWAQRTLSIEHAFLQTLDDDYDAPLEVADFADDPAGALLAINQWTSNETGGSIPELFAPGAIGADERLVIVDAIDFGASWAAPFDADETVEGPFTADDGTTGSVPLMSQRGPFGYAAGDGWQAVSLPYSGDDLSMIAILPAAGTFDSFEAGLDADLIATIATSMKVTDVALTMPRFSLDPGSLSLRSLLQSLGMTDAFDAARADFSGMTASQPLAIGDVVHRAFIDVDENGTQAAAATGVTIVGTWVAANAVTMTLDHAFVYAIRDDVSGALLFLGRMTSP